MTQAAIQLAEGTIYNPILPNEESLPTMYDLPSEDSEEPGLPDEFHYYQPQLLRETFQPTHYLPDRYLVGTDLNLYYDPTHTLWHKRPDWFAVLGIKRSIQQQDLRWSYVIWQEKIAPYLVIELLSPSTETEDLGRSLWDIDKPPNKWIVYERILKIPYYLVYSRYTNVLRAFGRVSSGYKELSLSNNRLWLPEANLGIGIWNGAIEGYIGNWLRFYNADEQWIPCQAELIVKEVERAEQEAKRAKKASQRAKKAVKRAEQEAKRANFEASARQAAEAEIAQLKAMLGLS